MELLLGPNNIELQQILKSGGSGRPLHQIKMNVKTSSLICPNKDETADDAYCLFLAITLTLEYRKIQSIENLRERKLCQTEFSNLVNSPKVIYKDKRKNYVTELLNKMWQCGIVI